MIVGETPSFVFKINALLGIDLNQATELEIKITNNGVAFKTYLMTNAPPSNVTVDGTGLIATAILQHVDSLNLDPGRIMVQLNIKMPTALYPQYSSDGFYKIAQFYEPVTAAA